MHIFIYWPFLHSLLFFCPISLFLSFYIKLTLFFTANEYRSTAKNLQQPSPRQNILPQERSVNEEPHTTLYIAHHCPFNHMSFLFYPKIKKSSCQWITLTLLAQLQSRRVIAKLISYLYPHHFINPTQSLPQEHFKNSTYIKQSSRPFHNWTQTRKKPHSQ